MSVKLPFDRSLGPITVTQLEHSLILGVAYPPQLYFSYDFALPVGADVLSIADGTVVSIVDGVPDGTSLAPIESGLDALTYPQLGPGGTGNQISVFYEALGLYVTYAHLAQDSIPFTQAEIDAGTAMVSQGDAIGQVGLTGTGTAPHLHVTYGTSTTGWGGSTSNVYPVTTIADGSEATNPPNLSLLFDEAGGVALILGDYVSENTKTGSNPAIEAPFGVTLNGIEPGDSFGFSVSSAGDVNGDGYADILFGASGADPNNQNAAGESYLVYGGASLPDTIELSGLNGSKGVILNGIDAGDGSGGSISSAGDFNGDGYDDILIGAPGATPNGFSNVGESYVVYGGASLPGTIELSSLNGSNGTVLNGVVPSEFSQFVPTSGYSVSSAGDVNADGYADILISARGAYKLLQNRVGESYVVYGGASLPSTIELSSLNGSNGVVLNSINHGDFSGISVSSAGDVNGDGFADILIGIDELSNETGEGEIYVFYGGTTLPNTIEPSSLNGSNGIVLKGIDAGDKSGRSVSSAGDVNGDGYDDILIGAYGADPSDKNQAGESYIVYGGPSLPSIIELSSLNGSNGVTLNGIDAGDISGVSVSGAGDVNGDGYDDILIGAEDASIGFLDAGESYLVLGGASLPGEIELSSLNGSNGFVLNGAGEFEYSGSAVSSAGDLNADGYADILIGAYGGLTTNGYTGKSYGVYGGPTRLAALDASDGSEDGQIQLANLNLLGPTDGPSPETGDPLYDSSAILAGTFLARAVYGQTSIPEEWRNPNGETGPGYNDRYSEYLASLETPWTVLTENELQSGFLTDPDRGFETGGLYAATTFTDFLGNGSEALVAETMIDGRKTVVLSFRGSDGKDALFGQTFDPDEVWDYYSELRPLINSVLGYVSRTPSDGIPVDQVIVSGHSLGGTMADVFTLVDAKLFEDAGVDLSVVSLASAGIVPGLANFADFVDPRYATVETRIDAVSGIRFEVISELFEPDYYYSINHSEDRVYFAANGDGGVSDGLALNGALLPNLNFKETLTIDLPNIENTDVIYDGRVLFTSGFGAEHNDQLYWSNVRALVSDPLFGTYTDEKIIMGVHDYFNYEKSFDYDGAGFAVFEAYTGGFGADNDTGLDRNLLGTNANEYILGRSGVDNLIGFSGDDLLSGGEGNDTLQGRDDDDRLHGGAGADILYGGSDNDTLSGGRDTDELYGEQGQDTFIVDIADFPFVGQDIIKDFNQGDSGSYAMAEGDVVDVSSFVGDLFNSGVPVSNLVKIEKTDGAASLYVDRDGSGVAGFFRVAILEGVPAGAEVAVQLDATPGAAPSLVIVRSEPGSYTISPPSQSVEEGTTTIEFTVTRPDDTLEETVYVSTTRDRGTSVNDGDYVGFADRAETFAAGVKTLTVSVNILDDGSDESVETFGLVVQAAPDPDLSPDLPNNLTSASFTIIDDDAPSGSVNFTQNNDNAWITPAGGSESFDALEGTDTITLDLRAWSSVSTSTSEATKTFTGSGNSVAISNNEIWAIIGSSGNDNIVTGDENDVILGLDGDDTIDGGAGIDAMDGGDGDDTFVNVGFGEVIAGGADLDRVFFDVSEQTSDIRINLETGEGAGGSWTGIEAISGSTGSGDDEVTLVARSNSTTLSFDGNGGEDHGIADFRGLSSNVNTSTSSSQNGRFFSTNTSADDDIDFFDVERFTVFGGSGNDNLSTTSGDDLIDGGAGADNISGGGGVNQLFGGVGNDNITSVGAGDIIGGGADVDFLNLRREGLAEAQTFAFDATVGAFTLTDGTSVTGIERLNFSGGSGDDEVTLVARSNSTTLSFDGNGGEDHGIADFRGLSSNVNTSTSSSQNGRFFSTNTSADDDIDFFDVERFTVFGGSGNDNLSTTSGDDLIDGGAGADNISGGGGVNQLFGGVGNDNITSVGAGDIIGGGADVDFLNLRREGLAEAQTFAFDATVGAFTLTDGTSVTGIERLNFSGGSGDDEVTLVARSNSTTLSFDGNGGEDHGIADFRGLSSNVNTSTSSSQNGRFFSTNTSADDDIDFFDVERFTVFGGSGNDNLSTTSGDDLIDGGAGADNISGGGGVNQLFGGVGNDNITSVGAGDIIGGGADVDFLNLRREGLAEAQTFAFDATVGAFTLTDGTSVTGIERLNFSGGSGDDEVTLVARSNSTTLSFDGNGGEDHGIADFRGLSSNVNTSTSSSQNGRFFSTNTSADDDIDFFDVERFTVFGGSGNDNLSTTSGDDLIDGGAGADNISGGGGVNQLFGGVGNDNITSVGAGDIIGGGADVDFLNLRREGLAEAQTFAFDATVGAFTLTDGTSVTGIERLNFSGGSGDDEVTLVARSNSTTLSFDGNGGEDHGIADFRGLSSNVNTSTSSSQNGRFFSTNTSADDDIDFFDVERFTVFGGSGNDNLSTTSGDDLIDGGAGADNISGGGGKDTLIGGEGNDTLTGGDGDDIFVKRPGESDDFITDFQKGSVAGDGDKIDISAYGFSFSDIVFETEASGLRVRLGTDSILLQGSNLLSLDATDFDGLTVSNVPPIASAIDAGSVSEDGAGVEIDLLGDAGASDSDGGTLGVANITVKDQNGAVVAFGLAGAVLTIDPGLFASTLDAGESATVTVSYTVTDGQGGETPNTATLVIEGLDGPFTWYLDGDGDGFGVDDAGTNQMAYSAPTGTSGVAGDADDGDGAIYPGAPEINDFKDNDQDGLTDEDNTDPVADAETFEIAESGTLVLPVSALLDGDTDVDVDTLTVASVSAAVNGLVELDDKDDTDPTNDEVIFTPDAGYDGPASFEYTVADGFGGEDTETVNVTVSEATGTVTTETRSLSNGRVLETEFVDGVRLSATMIDAGDAYAWSDYVDTFDAAGDRVSRVMTYDDGRLAETLFNEGVRVSNSVTDTSDAFVWSTLEREFNADGLRSSQTNTYDNGRVLETSFTSGIRSTATMTDSGDAYAWSDYVDTYDADGERVSRVMTYDDGRLAETSYSEGNRISSMVTDTADQFVWSTIERQFDANGLRSSQTNTYDNGRILEIDFVSGVRLTATMMDTADAYAWSGYVDSYNAAGDRVSRLTTFDDGTEVLRTFIEELGVG